MRIMRNERRRCRDQLREDIMRRLREGACRRGEARRVEQSGDLLWSCVGEALVGGNMNSTPCVMPAL